MADSVRYWLNGPAMISSKPATLILLLESGAQTATTGGGVSGGGGGGDGVGISISGLVSGADGAINVCSNRSTRVSKRSQILSKCSTAAVGFDSDSLSVDPKKHNPS